MPRKSGGSEAPSESSARTSLRRLSSIASFQALNPFARRRSNNATTESSLSSSSVSAFGTIITQPPSPTKLPALTSISHLLSHTEGTTSTALHTSGDDGGPASSQDIPTAGISRTRTFSNLPIPSRLYKNGHMVTSKSHSRLPSRIIPTRLPSPPTTNRKYSGSRLASAEIRSQHVKNRAKRSDTEPLLPAHFDHAGGNPRVTAFKENISPGTVHHLSNKNRRELDMSLGASASMSDLSNFSESSSASRYDDLEDFSPYMRYGEHSTRKEGPNASSEKWYAIGGRSATPKPLQPVPVQRWNSQPILSNTTNLGCSQHEIKQVRLMSARNPPTPPPPRTPLGLEVVKSARSKPSSSTRQLRQINEVDPTDADITPKPKTPLANSHYEVHKAEPVSYWCGRFAALEDRYRNEELAASLNTRSTGLSMTKAFQSSNADFWPRHESDQMHSPERTNQRRRRAIEHLHNLCTTVEARDSFVKFQLQFAAVQNDSNLARPVHSDRFGLGRSKYVDSEVRKMTFMDRLLGRGGRSRRSLVS